MEPARHWDDIYEARGEDSVSWFEPEPAVSLGLVRRALTAGASSVVDIGGGASRLVDHLLSEPLDRVCVVDVSQRGTDLAKRRLGAQADRITWIVGDVTKLDDIGMFDLWHDRAVFHFLIDPQERERYVALARRTVSEGGHLVIATFAPDGPDRCSGLSVCRYDDEHLAAELGDGFALVESLRHVHVTPRSVEQPFAYTLFRRE